MGRPSRPGRKLRVTLRPHIAGSDLLELSIVNDTKIANIIFAVLQDRRLRNILSVRDHNTFNQEARQKRLMPLNTLFLIHRYKAVSVHYVNPTDDNQRLVAGIRELGIYENIQTEIGQIIVAHVNAERLKTLPAAPS